MKLDFGQAIAPVPWPIQSSPTASARKPTINSNSGHGFPLLRFGIAARLLPDVP